MFRVKLTRPRGPCPVLLFDTKMYRAVRILYVVDSYKTVCTSPPFKTHLFRRPTLQAVGGSKAVRVGEVGVVARRSAVLSDCDCMVVWWEEAGRVQ